MRTPAGQECRYFYGDYYRGRNLEECRLIGAQQPPNQWTPDLCSTCPVPGILRANSCSNLVLEAAVKREFPWFKRRVKIYAACTRTLAPVREPHVGCGQCHPLSTTTKDDPA